MMGTMLYTHFRYLKLLTDTTRMRTISGGYKPLPYKNHAHGLARKFNMVHIFVENLMTSVDPTGVRQLNAQLYPQSVRYDKEQSLEGNDAVFSIHHLSCR